MPSGGRLPQWQLPHVDWGAAQATEILAFGTLVDHVEKDILARGEHFRWLCRGPTMEVRMGGAQPPAAPYVKRPRAFESIIACKCMLGGPQSSGERRQELLRGATTGGAASCAPPLNWQHVILDLPKRMSANPFAHQLCKLLRAAQQEGTVSNAQPVCQDWARWRRHWHVLWVAENTVPGPRSCGCQTG